MNAIVLMAIGDDYVASLYAVRDMFEKYASNCNAELLVCSIPPDPSFKRNILCQKMLLPDLYKHYEWMAFVDLDILISVHAPSIFDCTQEEKAFLAVVDPRRSEKFENVVKEYWRMPSILSETHDSYFSDRGFPDHPFPKASINGGVWLCRPRAIGDLFKSFYYSDFPSMIHEEAMMAHVAQKANLFGELDPRFNTHILSEIFTPPGSPVQKVVTSRRFTQFKERNCYETPRQDMFPGEYQALVEKVLNECYFLHFSGGFPFVNLPTAMRLNGGYWPPDLAWSRPRPRPASKMRVALRLAKAISRRGRNWLEARR